jgi:hypothetical protein
MVVFERAPTPDPTMNSDPTFCCNVQFAVRAGSVGRGDMVGDGDVDVVGDVAAGPVGAVGAGVSSGISAGEGWVGRGADEPLGDCRPFAGASKATPRYTTVIPITAISTPPTSTSLRPRLTQVSRRACRAVPMLF